MVIVEWVLNFIYDYVNRHINYIIDMITDIRIPAYRKIAFNEK